MEGTLVTLTADEAAEHVWPTEAEVQAAGEHLRRAADALDVLCVRMAHRLDHSTEPVPPPTLSEVGLLRQLADDAKGYGSMIRDHGKELGGIGGWVERAEGAWRWQREIVSPALAESEADAGD